MYIVYYINKRPIIKQIRAKIPDINLNLVNKAEQIQIAVMIKKVSGIGCKAALTLLKILIIKKLLYKKYIN